MLRRAGVFLTASLDDPCSNIVYEAIACGLVICARNSGGHPEVVGRNGLLFEGKDDVFDALTRAVNIATVDYRRGAWRDVDAAGHEYLEFMRAQSPPERRRPAIFIWHLCVLYALYLNYVAKHHFCRILASLRPNQHRE
jgi:glycosyltransferase involved in cell wall biosynthesis